MIDFNKTSLIERIAMLLVGAMALGPLAALTLVVRVNQFERI